MTLDEQRAGSRGRRVAGIAALGILGAALIVVIGMLVVQFVEWRQALTHYESAMAAQEDSLTGFERVADGLDAVQDELLGYGAVLDAILELDGEPIPQNANAGLLVEKAELALALAALKDRVTPEIIEPLTDLGSLSVADLEQHASRAAAAAQQIEDATGELSLFVDAAQHAASTAGAALAEFVDAVVLRSQALIAERQDASEESLQAFRSTIEALADVENTNLATVLGGSVTAAAEVLRSSNAVRIDDPNSVVVVVNKLRPLRPTNFVPQLVRVNVPYVSTPLLRQEAAGPLAEMFAAFREETGQQLRLQNSYRSYATQTSTYNYHVSTKGQTQADRGSARPGHSEHQTGLALDVNAVNGGCSIQQCFGDMVHGQWIEQNAWRFGWIVRYPKGYEHVTGYDWEPWHLRYVGVDVSTAMHNRGIATLEEYFGLDPAPNY